MKLTATQKKKIEEKAARGKFSFSLTVSVLCPICGTEFGKYPAASLNLLNRFVQATVFCSNCKQEVAVMEPFKKPEELTATETALEPDQPTPGRGAENAAPAETIEDTAHPPITGAGKADMLSFFTEDLANKELARKSLEPTTSQFDAPTFGMKGHDIDEEVEEATAPKFPVPRAALLGALISIVFFALLGAAAWYFEIPLPQQKPAPMVQPTLQPEARPLPPADGSTGTQWNKITCGDKPNGECTANPVPPFQFALTMNEDAWVEVDVDGKESLPGHILKKDENHIWFSVSKVNVRCGKPGAISYFIDGKSISPVNSADKPDKVEVVNFAAGMYPKEQ